MDLTKLQADTCYHIGISGGKDSGAVLLWMVNESGIPRHQIKASFCDTGWEHEHTYEQVAILSRDVHPIEVLKPEFSFFELAKKKGRFPSSQARFCTQHLKIYPSQDHIRYLQEAYGRVVAVSGVRGDESADRAAMDAWDYSGVLLCESWRQILNWSINDVIAIHAKYGVQMNPLYKAGAKRVGCFPCIMSQKEEIRMIAAEYPDRIDALRDAEVAIDSSFFPPKMTPHKFHSRATTNKEGKIITYSMIDDVVEWSMTGKRAKGSYLDDEPRQISCNSGFCE